MTLNSLMRWLKPREEVFFDLLDASVLNALEAARWFERELRTEDPSRWGELRRRMNGFEHVGDDHTRQVIERLDTTFVTPVERDDLMALAHALDDIVDHLDVVAERLVLYRIGSIRAPFLEISSKVVEGCELLSGLVTGLRRMPRPREIRPIIQEIHDLENSVDANYHTALAELFHDGLSAVEIMKWKELLDILETAMDRIFHAAQVVGSTVMKNA